MEDYISYIIKFLIGGDNATKLSSMIGYTSHENVFSRYRIVIIPSNYFDEEVYGTPASIPQLPLNEVEGIPLLFGTPEVEWYDDTLVVKADIVASTYFLITRYEEIQRRSERDIYGRFPGKKSLPYRAGFLHRPIVDEYGRLLRRWLREARVNIPDQEPQIKKIWLTHDIDVPFFCHSLRSLARESIKGIGFSKAWKIYRENISFDPYYTYPWLIEQRNELKNVLGKERCDSLFFFKAGGLSAQDRPRYNIHSKRIHNLIKLCEEEHIEIGLHASYDAGRNPSLLAFEKTILEKTTRRRIYLNRYHFLDSREPEDLNILEKTGITDDFSMGYADVAGFRLGTSHPVFWINPEDKRISGLILHPLTAMDCTLSDPKYMGMSYEEAQVYCLQLCEQVRQANGEVVLLWHNDRVAEAPYLSPADNWQRKLFKSLIEELQKE